MNQDITAENRKLLDKIVIEGKLHKLFKKTIKSENDIDIWEKGFLQSFEASDKNIILNHKILWRKNDESVVDAPIYGVAANWAQLKWLIENKRITRKMCDIEATDWANMLKIEDFRMEEVEVQGNDNLLATPIAEKRTLDKVIAFITDKLYINEVATGAKTAKYFESYKENVIAMQRMYDKGKSYLLEDVQVIFGDGHYLTWKETMKEMKEHCGFKEEHHDIIDIFVRMKNIAMKSAKEMPMKSKILHMQHEFDKWMIRKEADFIHGRDVLCEHRVCTQTVKEEYTPIMNMAFHCMSFIAGTVPEQGWRNAVTELYNTHVKEKPSYQAWQKNRLHLYPLLDKYDRGTSSGQNSIENKESSNDEPETEGQNLIKNKNNNKNYNQSSRGNRNNNSSNRGGFSNRNNNQNPSNGSRNFSSNFRGNNRGLTSRNNYQPPNRGNQNQQTRNGKRQCYHCSNHANRKVFHDFPFGGGPKCFYDKNGKMQRKVIAMCDTNSQNFQNFQNYQNFDQNDRSNDAGPGFFENPHTNAYDSMLNLPQFGGDTMTQNQIEHRDEIGYGYEMADGCLVGAILEDGDFKNMDGTRADGNDVDFEDLKDAQGGTNLATPILDCRFISPNKPNEYLNGRLTFDSGAANSMINSQALQHCQWKKAGPRLKKYVSAGGDDLPLWDFVVDVALEIAGQGMFVLKHVLVAETKMLEQVLVGRTDMNRLKMTIDFENRRMRLGVGKNNKWFPMSVQKLDSIATIKRASKGPVEGDVPLKTIDQVYKEIDQWKSKEDKMEILAKHEIENDCEHRDDSCDCDTWSISPQDGDNCRGRVEFCEGCEVCVDEKWKNLTEIEKEKPDIINRTGVNAVQYMNNYIERIRQRDLSTNTRHECTIDERIHRDDPELYCQIRALIDEYEDLFSSEIGVIEGREVEAEITGKFSSQRPGHQKFQGTTLVAVMKQFARQLAHGVLRKVEDVDVIPKNHMQILPVSKKDDDGNIVEAISATRVVINAQSTNAHTLYSGSTTDNLEDSIQFAAKASKLGLNLKADISDAYYAIKMKKSMWPYFCITVPFIGVCCYVRLPQGWAPAAQMCQDTLGAIYIPLWEHLRRYMDDIILASFKHRDDYLRILRDFFSLTRQAGLKLKGKKCFFCVRELNYLGNRIERGLIVPSKHYCSRIDDIAMESIKTRSQLKSYSMRIQFIARFMHRSADVLTPLRNASNGDGKLLVEWTEDLKQAFYRSKKALKELLVTHPFDPELNTVMVIDTSLIATGGFLYQVGPEGPRLISFFSRSRKDKERKCPLSSCHTETFGVVAGVTAFLPILRQCKNTITIVVDSKPLVQAFQKFRNFQYSDDTRLNNALYQIRSLVDVNFVHTLNVNPKLRLADVISRLGNFKSDEGCVGAPTCTICKAADMDNRDRLSIIAMINDMVQKGKNHGNLIDESYYMSKNKHRDAYWYEVIKPKLTGKVLAMFANKQNHTIETFKKDTKLIRTAQEKHGDYAKLFRDIGRGVTSYAKKKARLQTLLVTRVAKIENGILTIEKVINGVTFRVIPLPDNIAMIAVAAVHKSIGHQSVNQLVKHAQRHFEIQKLKEKVESYVGKCVKCTLMKGGGSVKFKMSPVPLPKEMFRTILADEVLRNVRNKQLKYIIAMEGLSSFVTVIPYKDSMTGERFVNIMAQIKSILCPHNNENVKITLRCDKAKWHTSAMVKETLALMNIELRLFESSTFSKNCIPELDVKIKNFGKNQMQIYEDKNVTLEQSCHLAAAVCNNTIGHLGYTPAEIFVGRGWNSNKTIQIDVQKILEELASRREQRRSDDERRKLQSKMKIESRTVPYNDKELNSYLVQNPQLLKMKKGDGITLKVAFNKNEPKCAWVVLKIDWGRQKVQAVRNSGLDMKESEPRWLDFRMIDRVFRAADRDWEHMMISYINEGKVSVTASKDEFNQFLRNCFFAMINRDDMDGVPDYLDLPDYSGTPSVSEADSMSEVPLEVNEESDSSWVHTERDYIELKTEDTKKEEEWMKEESKFEDFEELSQESLAESKEFLDKLEKEEEIGTEPEVKTEVEDEEEPEIEKTKDEKKEKKPKEPTRVLPRRKAKRDAQKEGSFSKYF